MCSRDICDAECSISGVGVERFGGLEDQKIGDCCRVYGFGVNIFVIFEDRYFNLESKIMFFVADTYGDYEFCEF